MIVLGYHQKERNCHVTLIIERAKGLVTFRSLEIKLTVCSKEGMSVRMVATLLGISELDEKDLLVFYSFHLEEQYLSPVRIPRSQRARL